MESRIVSTYVKVLLVMGILAVGVCAALPFRRGDEPDDSTTDIAADFGMKLRQGEKTAKLVPLAVSGEGEVSPASVNLPEETNPRLQSAPYWKTGPTHDMRSHVMPPPDMPPSDIGPSFVPLVEVTPSATLPGDIGANPIRAPETSPFAPAPVQPAPGPGFASVESIPVTNYRHRLRDGDTLARLARRYLGKESRADEIFQANRKVLTSPDVLPIGIEIEIPGARVSEDQ